MSLSAIPARGDVIMSAAGLNATLKKMERLTRQAEAGPAPARARSLFDIAMEADALASLMNDEVEAHGMQEKALLDLALSRTRELNIVIAYHRDKRKFFYDGKGFEQYLAAAPSGEQAAASAYKLIALEFYKSKGDDPSVLAAGAAKKQAFLKKYPRFPEIAEVSLFLAIDYRDLARVHRDRGEATAATKYGALARQWLTLISKKYPKTEQAEVAAQLLRRMDEETR